MQISAFGVYRQGRVNFSAHLQLSQDITISFGYVISIMILYIPNSSDFTCPARHVSNVKYKLEDNLMISWGLSNNLIGLL